MIIEDKQNILKSFEGRKIDQSVHVKRWGTINNQSPEDQNRLIFNKYAIGQTDSRQQATSQQHIFPTQESQVHQIDTGFKKLKNNQIEKLKELKQEYEVLRNLNIEEKPNLNIHPKPHSESSSLHQSPSQQMLSSSSRHKKSQVRNQNMSREAQILSLEKKQLEMVINNSMRKIEELLHNEMEYKKQIHELKLQVSGRQNVDVEYEQMIRTLKKGEMNLVENNEALKKENEKNKFQIRQLNQKITGLESELTMKDQQIRLLLGEKRKSQDLIRLQKDRYFNLDIDYKKTKMEYELLEKDKNNEINRLMKQLDFSGANKSKDLELKLKRCEADIEIKDKRYHVLMTQLEDLKMRYKTMEEEVEEYRRNYTVGQFDREKAEEILANFRQQNDSVAFGRQMNDLISKLHEVDHHQNDHLREQIEMLKMQLQGVRENEKQQAQMMNVQIYAQRVEQLERAVRQESQEKNELVGKLKRLEREYDDVTRKLAQSQKEVQSYESMEVKMREEIRTLRVKSQSTEVLRPSLPIGNVDKPSNNKQLEASLKETAKYKHQVQQLQNELRSTRRIADQNEFKVTKTATQLEFRIKMLQTQHNTMLVRINQEIQRERKQFVRARNQFEHYRGQMQRKLHQKQTELENVRAKLRLSSDSTHSNINNIKLEYEAILKGERENYKLELEQLSTQVTSLSKINEKYMQQTTKYVHYENQLSCLREIMRKSIHLSEGVDHLWRIKETEYQNLHSILNQIHHSNKADHLNVNLILRQILNSSKSQSQKIDEIIKHSFNGKQAEIPNFNETLRQILSANKTEEQKINEIKKQILNAHKPDDQNNNQIFRQIINGRI